MITILLLKVGKQFKVKRIKDYLRFNLSFHRLFSNLHFVVFRLPRNQLFLLQSFLSFPISSMAAWSKSVLSKEQIQLIEDQAFILTKALVRWNLAGDDTEPTLNPSHIPLFRSFVYLGFCLPESYFLADVLEHYNLELDHLGPSSILILSVFVYLCEAFLGIPPFVCLFCRFYQYTPNNICQGLCGSVYFKLYDNTTHSTPLFQLMIHGVITTRSGFIPIS